MIRSWSAGSPRTINPPTAPQPKPSTESCIPVRPKTRNCIAIPPTAYTHYSRNALDQRHADAALVRSRTPSVEAHLNAIRKPDDEVVAIGHVHLRQGLRIHRIVRADQFVLRENVGRERVDFIIGERTRRLKRNGAANEIEDRRCIRPEILDGLLRRGDTGNHIVTHQGGGGAATL